LQRALGSHTQSAKQLRDLAARTEEARAQASAYVEEQGLYKDLAHAFSRDGVQAMLMEQALPRLQQIANDMLERMTGGRITVQLRTQKTAKAGNMQETLDILISDDLGQRDYEMYSGGEAFRVDFALRIALARLLAERAGAELPTLIIDEGFGSQDEDGIDRLVEAIYSVSEEFRLILVVTHVEELKGRFEQRIEVTKDPEQGSFARIV
jgi:exonuclease SbcC